MATTETLIGPSTCPECGDDYGFHQPGCSNAPQSTPAFAASQVDSWVIVAGDTTVIRDKGVVIYAGPTKDLPIELQKLAAEFTVEFAEVAHKLLGTPKPTPPEPPGPPWVIDHTGKRLYQMKLCKGCGQPFVMICPCGCTNQE